MWSVGGMAPRSRPMYEELGSTVIALAVAAYYNVGNRRPLFSRVYIYPLAAALGFAVGRVLSDINEKRIADRELAIWEYVRRHPEDFPEIAPKKYKDVLQTWHPIR